MDESPTQPPTSSSASNESESRHDIAPGGLEEGKMAEDETPPPYNVSSINRHTKIQTEWFRNRPEDWDRPDGSNLPAITIYFKPDEPKQTFLSRLLGKNQKNQWQAAMQIVTCNTPGLMRRGLYWGPESVDEAGGWIRLNDRVYPRMFKFDSRWKHTRAYRIWPPGEEVEWMGFLYGFAREPSTLSHFDIACITPEVVEVMMARNWNKELVYLAYAGRPDYNFNTIYDSMPLKGWWIWPKAESSTNERVMGSLTCGTAMENSDDGPRTNPVNIAEPVHSFRLKDILPSFCKRSPNEETPEWRDFGETKER